jgi:hypothetical protein
MARRHGEFMKWLLLLLAGCDIGVPATTTLHRYAVVSLVETADRCMNMPHFHYTFAVDEPAARLVHASGGFDATSELPRPWMNSKEAATYYVAELAMQPVPEAPIASRGMCASEWTSYWGEVKRVVPAATLADARAKLAVITRDGWPSR